MPIFQHGKNAFLALGFENAATQNTNTFTSLTANSCSLTVQGGSLLANDTALAVVGSTSYYGAFILPAGNQNMVPMPSLAYPVVSLAAPATGTFAWANTIDNSVSFTSGTGYALPMFNLSPYINTIEFPTAVDAAETTTFNATGVKSYIVGLKDYTLTFSGQYDGSSTIFGESNGGLDYIFQQMFNYQNTPGSFINFVYGPADPGGFVGGNPSPKYFGQGVLTKYDLKSPVSGVITFDAELQVTGSVSRDLI
jgi:hypothetical protein